MRLVEVVDSEPEPAPTGRLCDHCGQMRALSRFRTADRDDPEAPCASFRAPRPIPDPKMPPTKVMAAGLAFPIPDDWVARIHSGANLKVEVVLHIDHALGAPDGTPMHWSARLEVSRISE